MSATPEVREAVLEAQVAAVRAIHHPVDWGDGGPHATPDLFCAVCEDEFGGRSAYPCPTIVALDAVTVSPLVSPRTTPEDETAEVARRLAKVTALSGGDARLIADAAAAFAASPADETCDGDHGLINCLGCLTPADADTAERTVTLDLATGDWAMPGGISTDEALRCAAALLPGVHVDRLAELLADPNQGVQEGIALEVESHSVMGDVDAYWEGWNDRGVRDAKAVREYVAASSPVAATIEERDRG